MWIKLLYNQNTFNVLEFPIFTKFDQKLYFKNVVRVKTIKAPTGFELMIYRFVVIALPTALRC